MWFKTERMFVQGPHVCHILSSITPQTSCPTSVGEDWSVMGERGPDLTQRGFVLYMWVIHYPRPSLSPSLLTGFTVSLPFLSSQKLLNVKIRRCVGDDLPENEKRTCMSIGSRHLTERANTRNPKTD